MWRPAVASEPTPWISQEARDTCVHPRRLRILVVDHDARGADSLEQLLHATGYPETRVAYTARGAVVFVHEFRPEVVLMDMDMPEVDEPALNRTLVERAQLRHMCLVSISARPTHREAGADGSAASSQRLLKPISARDLAACLLHAAATVR